jgi:hypothetical protein
VDFTKAFDSVSHSCLWYRLLKDGAHGRLIQTIRSMYLKLQSSVVTPEGITEFFQTQIGVRQGCQLSTFLFNHYLNEFIDMCKVQNCHGVYVNEVFPNVMTLLYADDLIEGSDTVGRLHKLIDVLSLFCDKWGLSVNMTKTKVIVFHNGGILKHNERWFYKGQELEIYYFYRYLGIVFTVKMVWTLAQKTVAAQGLKALNFIKHIYFRCNGLPVDTCFELFDKMVKPIVTYGAELWGCNTHKCLEDIQVKFGRFILGLPSSSPRSAVLGELALQPLNVDCSLKSIKYWLKLLKLDRSSLNKSAYLMLLDLDRAGRTTWVCGVRSMLINLGFGVAWDTQQVGDETFFLNQVQICLMNNASQEWYDQVTKNGILGGYAQFKKIYCREVYLSTLSSFKLRNALAKLRCSSHDLQIEKGRHLAIPQQERIC